MSKESEFFASAPKPYPEVCLGITGVDTFRYVVVCTRRGELELEVENYEPVASGVPPSQVVTIKVFRKTSSSRTLLMMYQRNNAMLTGMPTLIWDEGLPLPVTPPSPEPEPEPVEKTVPFVDYKLARDALLYWKYECSGAEPSLSVFERMVDDALSQNQPKPVEKPDLNKLPPFEWLLYEDAVQSDEKVLEGVKWLIRAQRFQWEEIHWQTSRRMEVQEESKDATSVIEALQQEIANLKVQYAPRPSRWRKFLCWIGLHSVIGISYAEGSNGYLECRHCPYQEEIKSS